MQAEPNRVHTFVEFGARDGVDMSNTLLFERGFGWEGVLVEAAPRYIKNLRLNRNCLEGSCVFAGLDEYGNNTLWLAIDTTYSDLDTAIKGKPKEDTSDVEKVNTTTLDVLLQKFHKQHIDL